MLADNLIPTNKRTNSGIPPHPTTTMSSEDGGHWFEKSLKQRCMRGTGNKEGGQADSRVHGIIVKMEQMMVRRKKSIFLISH